jgi:peptide/nickel transport system ATP-binding protein
VERGPATEVLRRPAHPYTKGLLAALPKLAPAGRGARLSSIPGRMVDLANPPSGCFFAARCAFAEPACEAAPQTPRDVGDRVLRCWKAELLGDWPAPVPLPAPPPRPPWRGAPLLRLTEVRKIYGGGWSLLRRAVPGVPAVDAVSLSIAPGEVFGLVGESGSGKSTLGRLSLYLQKPSAGTVEFRGSDLDGRSERLLRPFRKAAQLVFQNADASLNPRLSIGEALARPLQLFEPGSKAQRAARVLDLLDMVRLPRAYAQRYPHQLSGGEKQRVAIARTLATRPDFIVCDEPVSALDVSVQAAIVNLLADLRDSAGLAYLFISHDLAMVAQLSDRIAVMYRGRICETGTAAQVLEAPFHPYTAALLAAVPRVEGGLAPEPPPPRPETGLGCAYRARCARHMGAVCDTVVPPLVTLASGHAIACHRQERAA